MYSRTKVHHYPLAPMNKIMYGIYPNIITIYLQTDNFQCAATLRPVTQLEPTVACTNRISRHIDDFHP